MCLLRAAYFETELLEESLKMDEGANLDSIDIYRLIFLQEFSKNLLSIISTLV